VSDVTLKELARDASFGFRDCAFAFDLGKAFYSNRKEDPAYKKKIEQTLSRFQIVPVDMVFDGFDRKLLNNFIQQIDLAQKCFESLVSQKAFDRTFLWVFRYKAGIKKKLDTHFKKLSVLQTAAKKALPGDQSYIPKTDRSLTKIASKLFEQIKHFFKCDSPEARCDSSEAQKVAISAIENQKIFAGKSLIPFLKKAEGIAAELNCKLSEAWSIVAYIETNRKKYIGKIDPEPPLRREKTGLIRTIQFDGSGKVWIYQNRFNQNDKIFGAGEFKRVTGAIDYDQIGEKFARPVGKGKSKDGKDISAVSNNELRFLRLFGSNTEGVVETYSTRVYKGKDGTKWSAVQKYYETDLNSELMRNALTPQERMKIALDLCAGMTHIHGESVVHRDIKPHNILFTRANGRVKAVFADFGLACTNDEIRDRSCAGSPKYMAPEYIAVVKSNNYSGISNAVDIYSLGLTLEELFKGQTQSREMKNLIDRMLAKKPENRPTAQEALSVVQTLHAE